MAKGKFEEDLKDTAKMVKKIRKLNKPKDNYRIIRIEQESDSRPKKITMLTFQAKDDEAAYKYLVDYRKIANKAYTYYFDYAYGYIKNGKNGNPVYVHDLIDVHEPMPFYKKAWNIVLTPFQMLHDWKHDIADKVHMLRTNHSRTESWDLHYHMLNDIIYNVPILIERGMGVPTHVCNAVYAKAHEKDPNFSLEAALAKDPSCATASKYLDKATVEWHKMLNYLLEHTSLYIYYDNFGIVDEKHDTKPLLDVHKKYKSTIPLIKGTYDHFDYKKLDALKSREWNIICNWIKANGQALWD